MIEAPIAQGVIACPYCQTAVPITVQSLLANIPSTCPGGSASFEVSPGGSQDALDKLSQWKKAMDDVASEANEKLADTDDQQDPLVAVKRKRRPRRGAR